MLECIFSSDYRNAKNRYDTAKAKRNKLSGIRNDITNDSASITSITKKCEYIYDNFAKTILASDVRSRVCTKLNALKEPYQTSDVHLSSARSEIDDEMRLLKREMDKAEATMDSIKNETNGSW